MSKFRSLIPILCLVILIFVAGCTQAGSEDGPQSSQPSAASTLTGQGASATQSAAIQPAVTDDLKHGTVDPDFVVDISVPEKIHKGTTLLADNHDTTHPRIIEVNRLGEIVWEYPLEDALKSYTNPGWDVEVLPNGNILTELPRKGVYEINRNKQIVWSYADPKISHDADRLPNGNTLIAFGGGDTKNDAQVKEVNPEGKVVWSWHAYNLFNKEPYLSISNEGWTHTNAVTRLSSGNTLISPRNFNFIVEVDPQGNLVRKIGEGLITSQHDPEVLPNGNILLANQGEPHEALELDPKGDVIWRFPVRMRTSWPVRDADRLPNGNTLVTESDRIVEVTPDGKIVWQFRMTTPDFTDAKSRQSRGFYKADRISS